MSLYFFIIFREGRLVRAGRQPGEFYRDVITFNGCRFERCQGWVHQYHHLVDRQQRLGGFLLDLDRPDLNSPAWRQWVASCDNCSFADKEFTIWLVNQLPGEYCTDCASIIGGDFYHDGHDEFIVTISDMNNVKIEDYQWHKMWESLAFDLVPITIKPENF